MPPGQDAQGHAFNLTFLRPLKRCFESVIFIENDSPACAFKRRPDTHFLYCSVWALQWLLSHQPHHQHQSFVIALIRHPRRHHFLFRHRHPSRRRLTSPTLAAAQESSTPAVDHPSQPYSQTGRSSIATLQITSIACVVSPHCSPITAVTIHIRA